MKSVKKWFSKVDNNPVSGIDFHKSKIDLIHFGEIREKYMDADPYPGFSKYLELDRYLGTALCHYDLVGLKENKSLSILDIGTGAGYFPFVCVNFGHSVHAIDVPDQNFYREMVDLLGVVRLEHNIQSFESLPPMNRRFDLITAFAVCFNGHATEALWGVNEWHYFLSNLRETVAKPKAELFMKLNCEPNGAFYTDEVREYFESEGAILDKDIIRVEL